MILGMPISLLLQWWWQATKQAISLATAITATAITTIAATSDANDLAAAIAMAASAAWHGEERPPRRRCWLAPRGGVLGSLLALLFALCQCSCVMLVSDGL